MSVAQTLASKVYILGPLALQWPTHAFAERLYKMLFETVFDTMAVRASLRHEPFSAFSPHIPVTPDEQRSDSGTLIIIAAFDLDSELLEVAQNADRLHIPIFFLCRQYNSTLRQFLRREHACTWLITYNDELDAAQQLKAVIRHYFGLQTQAESSTQL